MFTDVLGPIIIVLLVGDILAAATSNLLCGLTPTSCFRRLRQVLAASDARFAFLIPAIALAVGAGASWLKSRAQGKAQKEQQNLYNEWLKNRQNGTNDMIEKLTAKGFDPFGAQTSTQTGTSSSTTSTNQKTSPFITEQFKPLVQKFTDILQGRLESPSSLPAGYLGAVARGTNDAYQGARVAAQNAAARRGFSGEQALSVAEPIEAARAGKIADVANQIPLLNRQLQNEDINMASGAAGQFGKGMSTSGTSSMTSGFSNTATTPPNIGVLASLLLPPSPNAGKETGISSTGQLGGDLSQALLKLFGMGAFGGQNPAGNPGGTGIGGPS